MPITIAELNAMRPVAYHVCGAVNFDSIKNTHLLKSAQALLENTEYEALLTGRRSQTSRVSVGGQLIEIRDHRPLALGSLSLPAGYTANQFIAEFNSRVFLWAGTSKGPVESGRNHIGRYTEEGEVFILKVPLLKLIDENSPDEIEVTFCNSGAARHHKGKPAQRSPATFSSLKAASRRAAEDREITFRTQAKWPPDSEYSKSISGPWHKL
jgi:hypothetical protein